MTPIDRTTAERIAREVVNEYARLHGACDGLLAFESNHPSNRERFTLCTMAGYAEATKDRGPLTDAEVAGMIRGEFVGTRDRDDFHVLTTYDINSRLIRKAFALGQSRGADTMALEAEAFRKGHEAGVSSVDVRAKEREAASKGWDAALDKAHQWVQPMRFYESMIRERDHYLAATYDPTPSVTLSDGSVVTYSGGNLHRSKGSEPRAGATLRSWLCLLSSKHTGADWDALKAFAAALTEPSHDR